MKHRRECENGSLAFPFYHYLKDTNGTVGLRDYSVKGGGQITQCPSIHSEI